MSWVWPTAKPAVLTAITILDAAFTDVAVSAKMPTKRPEKFIKVSRIGGNQEHVATDVARLLIECFGVDTAAVESMCNTARAALRNAEGHTVATTAGNVFLRSWRNESGPVDFPHPDIIDRERWQFFGELHVKSN